MMNPNLLVLLKILQVAIEIIGESRDKKKK